MEFSDEFRKRFVRKLQGKDFILYGGLLKLAQEKGLKRLTVDIVQIPSEDNGNLAVCTAMAEGEDGVVYSEVGDASPSSVNANIAPHILRMAATRAKARALRDFTGIDMVALEELGELEDDSPQDHAAESNGGQLTCSSCGGRLTKPVYEFSIRRFKRPLCMACQRSVKAG